MATVLTVENDPSVQRLLRTVLAAEGYQVREASNGLEALKEIRQECPDVVVIDLIMPEMSGVEMLKKLQKLRGRPPVVALSAARLPASVKVEANVPKPFDPAELSSVVRHTMEHRPA